MGVDEEYLRLLVQVKGDKALADLQAELGRVDARTQTLNTSFKFGIITEEAWGNETRKLVAAHASLSAQIDFLNGKVDTAKNKMAGLGQAGLQTGRVIQDFAQGGVGGVLNNIEGLAMAVGGGPGLAGVLTGLGVAFYLLKDPIRNFVKTLGEAGYGLDLAKDKAEALKEKIKELSEKDVKLAVDRTELDEAEKQLERVRAAEEASKRAGELKSKDETEAGAEATRLLAEAPGGAAAVKEKVVAGLTAEADHKSRATIDPYLKEAEAGFNRATANGDAVSQSRYLKEYKDYQEYLRQALLDNRKAAERLYGEAFGKASSRGDTADFAKLVGDAGFDPLARRLRNRATPAGVANARKAEEVIKENEDKAKALQKEIDDAVSATRRGTGEDVGERALKALAGGEGRVAVGLRLIRELRASLDAEAKADPAHAVPEAIRDVVSEQAVKSVMQPISNRDVERRRDADKKAAKTEAYAKAREAAKGGRAGARENRADAAERDRRLDEGERRAKAIGLDQMAREAAEAYRKQGGARWTDEFGRDRFKALNKSGQQSAFQEDFREVLKRALPDMDASERTGVAQRMAETAFGGADDAEGARRVGAVKRRPGAVRPKAAGPLFSLPVNPEASGHAPPPAPILSPPIRQSPSSGVPEAVAANQAALAATNDALITRDEKLVDELRRLGSRLNEQTSRVRTRLPTVGY